MTNYVPCPKCGSANVDRMGFTWWGGVLGPRLLTHVKCKDCRATYNGKNGNSNTGAIAIYTVVLLVIGLVIGFALVASQVR